MDTPMPPDLPERVAVLERLFERMDRRLDRIEQQLSDLADRLGKLSQRIENMAGRVAQLPTMWQLITYTLGAPVTLAGLLFAAFKLGHA